MLFTGTYPRTLDEKLRLVLPKRLRDGLGRAAEAPLYLAPGTDGSLALYAEDAFTRMGQQLGQGSPTGPDTRAFSRLFYAQAQPVELDAQGRLRIPQELAALAGIVREVVLLGVRDHLELWDKERWEQYLARQQPQYDGLAEGAFALSGDSPRNHSSSASHSAINTEFESRPNQPR